MRTKDLVKASADYERIERAIKFLESNFKTQPNLEKIAKSAYLSKFHFQRLFKRWAGISPDQFLSFLTLEYAKQKLSESRSLLDVSLEAGLSGPSRLHDLFVTFEAMTPGEYKQLGEGLQMEYGFHSTPFGECLIALTRRGISHLGFVETKQKITALRLLRGNWPGAVLTENQAGTKAIISAIFAKNRNDNGKPFHLLLKGTNFQVNVWRALLSIPKGNITSYQNIAEYIGYPKAVRAVGQAIANNPIGYLIPCHRVIAESGKIHQYRWGAVRKKAIIGWEAAAGAETNDFVRRSGAVSGS